MDFETAEHILIPIATLLIGIIGTWLKGRGDTQKLALEKSLAEQKLAMERNLAEQRTTIESLESHRDDRREDFQSLVTTLQAEMKRLQEDRDKADTKAEKAAHDLAEFKGFSEAKILALEEKVGLLEAVVDRARLICPHARAHPEDCALTTRAIAQAAP